MYRWDLWGDNMVGTTYDNMESGGWRRLKLRIARMMRTEKTISQPFDTDPSEVLRIGVARSILRGG